MEMNILLHRVLKILPLLLRDHNDQILDNQVVIESLKEGKI